MKHIHPHHHRGGKLLYTIYLIGFIFTLQAVLPVYINSTFLGQFVSERTVGLIYLSASILTMIALANIGYFIRKFGNYKTATSLILVQMITLVGLVTSSSIYSIIAFFISNLLLVSLIGFNIDIFLEANSDDNHTGGIRGLYMTVLNTAWILSPMLAGALVTSSDYWKIYAAATGLLLPLLFILYKNFRKFEDPIYQKTKLLTTYKKVWADKNFANLFIVNIILNTFYSWMVIYTPIYLHEHVGFSWNTIGLIFTIMLLPFVIFELPAGKLADTKWGEKEFMYAGFFIIGFFTILLSFIDGAHVWLWAGILFATRIGASLAEVMIEIYFFKHIHTTDENILRAFRITRPSSYIVAPLVTIIGLYFVQYRYLFVLLGLLTFCALPLIARIKDTN